MHRFTDPLSAELAASRTQGLLRQLRRIDAPQSPQIEMAGQRLLNFSSNDYLGLANHPLLKQRAVEATERYGAGSGASRLICGSLAPHHELEERLAEFKGTEAALVFSSGYAASLGTIPALVGRDDVVVIDKLVHASIVDAARLSGATLRVFRHNNVDGLADILRWADQRKRAVAARRSRCLIVTESVFSMDGDLAPLKEILGLKEQFGAWLMVDEAHATGLYGARRRGLAEACELSGRIEIQMGTLGKAVGASGGYICGSRTLIDFLINRARSFIFSTAPVPAAAAAASAGIEIIQSLEGKQRCEQLWQRVEQVATVKELGVAPSWRGQSAIVPILIGSEQRAVEVADALRQRGHFVPAIRYPSVARGKARLRVTLSAGHSAAEVAALLESLQSPRLQNATLSRPSDPA